MFEWLLRRFGNCGVAAEPRDVASSALVPPSGDWWVQVEGESLAQGDLLAGCFVPAFPDDFGSETGSHEITISIATLIVLTQSCDLENHKVAFVALCPAHALGEFEERSPDFAKKGKWEEVRRGRFQGLYLLASTVNPTDNRQALVVDFRQVISLPIGYLSCHARKLGRRYRLQSPYLEHFSQAFGQTFTRVARPSDLAPFK